MSQLHDEGIQFVLEDNLLNHLLVSSDSVSAISSNWLTQSCKAYYERSLNAPYVPLYI